MIVEVRKCEAVVAPPIRGAICLYNLAVSPEQQGSCIGAQLIKSSLYKKKRRGRNG
jgi:predicted N-acetyltransferase YhbS